MKPTPYLFFNGKARKAIAAYADIFDVPIPEMMTMAAAPPDMEVPEDRKAWVMHCQLPIGDGSIMISDDVMANSPAMDGCSVMVELPTAAEAKAIFDRLADGGEVRMPWEPTFWAAGFGTLTDRFGIRWMVGTSETPA